MYKFATLITSLTKSSDLLFRYMCIKKYCITLILLLFNVCVAYSQESSSEICVDFRVNCSVIDSTKSDNAVRMQEKIDFLKVGEWNRNLHIKTNTLGLGLAIANVAAEIDLAKHWSFSLPVYYSAWDYFKSTIKFRTFAVQPEFRYWLSDENDGFFAGAHFGLAYYNVAFDGDYRYQDHNCNTPAIGGGVSMGYRLPISKNNRWRVEFSLGAGAYTTHHDKFYNTPNTKGGLMIETIKKTYWGIDHAAVSFSYSFDLKKKGGT